MKKKIFTVAALLGILGGLLFGFLFGYDSGRITNDRARITAELSRMDRAGERQMRQVAKSTTGKMEVRVINRFLEQYDLEAESLRDIRRQLEDYDRTEKQQMLTDVQIQVWENRNRESYRKLEDLTENPDKYLKELLAEEDASEYEPWIKEWCDDLQKAGLKAVFQEELEKIYEENLDFFIE